VATAIGWTCIWPAIASNMRDTAAARRGKLRAFRHHPGAHRAMWNWRAAPSTDDLVSCLHGLQRDPAEFPDPDTIDFAREDNRHTAFSYGPHRCLGSHLARREVIIALGEWFARIPPFRIKPGTRRSRSAASCSGWKIWCWTGARQ
jgi:cytochrome P450